MNIKKDICVNRCPSGATDRRLARLFSHKIVVTFGRVGGYFCVLLLSLLPMAYPRPKQVRHKPITEINPSIVNIRISPPFSDSLAGFYVSKIHCNRRVTSLRRGLTAYHLDNTHTSSLSQAFVFFDVFRQTVGILGIIVYKSPFANKLSLPIPQTY